MRWLGMQAASLEDLSITERLTDAPKPGAPARITAEQVCQRGYSSSVRNVPAEVSREVYSEYVIVERTTGEY